MHQEFDPRDLEPSLPARDDRPVRSKVAPIMIALVALAGFGGVVWYAYDQGVRQAAPPGATPLIKADTGPTKVRPEQPGGMDVPHQNSLVLNSLPDGDKDKSGAPPVERLLPPAETPLPRPTATAPIAPGPTASAPAAPPAAAPGTPSLPPKIGPTPPPAATSAAVAPVIPAPLQTGPAQPAPAQIASAPPPVAPAPPAAQPAPRPPVQIAAAPKPTPAIAANGSGYRVRLVSVKSQDQTGQEWARLQRMYPQLASLQMSVTRVELGEKGVWYRIHAGPLSDAHAASQLCDAITAKDKSQGCLVEKP